MGVKNLKDGEDFGPEHFPKDFGFSGSSGHPKATRHAAKPAAEHNPVHTDEHPGHDGGEPGNQSHFAHGGAHPHGHKVIDVQHYEDGSVVMHHEHGGMTVHHPDGHISHHDHAGQVVHAAHGGAPHGEHHQDASTFVGKVQRGLEGVGNAVKEHEHAEGEYAFGGRHPRLPRAMRPAMARPRSPIGHTAPSTGPRTPTPRNPAPGGAMGMGVEPSAEPDVAGTLPGAPGMKKGGHHRF